MSALAELFVHMASDVTGLVNLTHVQAETLCLSQESSFSNRIHSANNKTDAETRTAQALFNGQ